VEVVQVFLVLDMLMVKMLLMRYVELVRIRLPDHRSGPRAAS
jgi:hypothetical protein